MSQKLQEAEAQTSGRVQFLLIPWIFFFGLEHGETMRWNDRYIYIYIYIQRTHIWICLISINQDWTCHFCRKKTSNYGFTLLLQSVMLPTGGGCDAALSKLARFAIGSCEVRVSNIAMSPSLVLQQFWYVLMALLIFSDVQSDVYGGGKIWLYHIVPQLARRTSPVIAGRRGIRSRKWLPLSSRRWNTESVPGCSCLQVIFYHLVMTNIAMV